MKKLFAVVCVICAFLLPGCSFRQAESSAPDRETVLSREQSRPTPSPISITNFTAFDGYFVAEIKDLGADRFSLGRIRRQKGKSCYTVEDVDPYPFPPIERALCFEAYEIDGEDYLFTRTGFYKVSRDAVEEVRSFPEQRYASVQYDPSLRAFLYIDLLDRSLYLDPLEGEARCICKGQFVEEDAASQGQNPFLPHLKEYPLKGCLSQQMILYWYFHADGKRSLRLCDLEGNLLSETDRIDGLPCNPEWWGSGFLQQDAFLLWRLETERDAAGNYIYTTYFTLYDQSLQAIKSMDIPYGVDPYSTFRRGAEDQTFYVIGSTSHEGATAIKEQMIEVCLDEETYEVLAEE